MLVGEKLPYQSFSPFRVVNPYSVQLPSRIEKVSASMLTVCPPNVTDYVFADLVCRILSSLPISSLASVRRRLGPLILADIVGVRGFDIPVVQRRLKFAVDVAPSLGSSSTYIFILAISVASFLFVG